MDQQPSKTNVPGQDDDAVVVTIYFGIGHGQSPKVIFRKITNWTNPPIATSGGAYEAGCSIKTPDDRIFHALQIHGDLAGWRADISAGAAAEGVVLALIEDNAIVTGDGCSFDLATCTILFL